MAGSESNEPGEKKPVNDDGEAEPERAVLNMWLNNVGFAFATGCPLSLREIALKGYNVELVTAKGNSSSRIKMSLRSPRTSSNIYSSGKVTALGAISERDAYAAARRMARQLQKVNPKVRLVNYRVTTVNATTFMPFLVDCMRLRS